MKYCKKCDIEKPETEFHKDRRVKCGLRSRCKACCLKYKADNADKIAEYQRSYRESNPEREAARHREYRADNAEKIAGQKREYHAVNRDHLSNRQRERYASNPEKIAGQKRAYRTANPDKIAATSRNRRARLLSAEGSHTANEIKAIFDSQRGLCATCNKKLFRSGEKKFHVDHIQPISKGGSNDKYNLQCLCPGCNIKKNAKDPLDWAKENNRLL